METKKMRKIYEEVVLVYFSLNCANLKPLITEQVQYVAIHTPADHSRPSSNSRNKFVPYRDSVLTWLLKDTLQGNSNTIMVATVSPSSTSYSETVNTLRFGQRAKLIVYKPVIVEDSKERTIRELRAEIARLRDLLRSSSQITSISNPEDPMNIGTHQPDAPINEIPEETEPGFNVEHKTSQSSRITSLTNFSEFPVDEPSRTLSSNSDIDNSLSTLNNPQEEQSPKDLENSTTETLLPIMSVKSSVVSETPKKLKRTFSMDRTYSIETDVSKSFSSLESLQSPKHSSNGRTATSRESSSTSSNNRRLSGSTPPTQPKQTSLSLRRQLINRSNPSLRNTTQKKILTTTAKKLEKGIVTEESGAKNTESKTDSGKKPPYVKPRAQIVAAVTSRLYSKVNKKDIGTSTENLAIDHKEPPKELTICTNARNKLRELTQKALRAHRSKSEETQTELFPVLRVKEVATDCSDLKQELSEVKDAYTLDKREYKDAEVECTLINQFTEGILKNLLVITRSCGIQTTGEDKAHGGVSFTKYLTECQTNPIFTEAVNINISHNYLNGNRTGSLSDDSLDNQHNNVSFPTPDLISNHNSLEQHVLNTPQSSEDKEESIETKTCYAESNALQDLFENISHIPASHVCASTASVLTVPNWRPNYKSIDVLTTRASEIILKDALKEKCQSLPDFCPQSLQPNILNCLDTKYDKSNISYHKPVVRMCQPSKTADSSSESGESVDNIGSDIPDSIDYHMANKKKVQFTRKARKHKKERMLNAMKDFLEEAKQLMTNISCAAHNVNDNSCQQPHLDEFDIQVTLNDVSGLTKTHSKRRRRLTRENNGTQTDEPPSMESCFSQTSLDFPEYMLPINKYEALLEDSCKRLEARMKQDPRSRNISITSEEYEDEITYSRPKYNPWDLSNVDVEDSSLESNPVTFSDYGSLPRKAHKRQRTPTCSPSAFLKQLTHMRRQIIESSREELLQGYSGSK